MTPRRRVGLIGLGAISRYYLDAIENSAHWELAAVCDLAADRLTPLRGKAACFDDHRAMLRETDLDAVIITAPNDAHLPLARDVLLAGVPVCVEKPLALRAEDGEELLKLAESRGLCLFTAFHRRYNDAVDRLIEQISGTPIRSLTVRYLERIEDHIQGDRWYLDPERCGGGCVADNGPNAFDLVRLLLGETRVDHARIRYDATGVDREATVRLSSASGAVATVALDWSYPGEVKDIEVHLADGRRLTADMLAGHHGFKESLRHEYVGVLRDFASALPDGGDRCDSGLPALSLVRDTYTAAAANREDGAKRTVAGTLVKVLLHRREDRGMSLDEFAGRCVRGGELHELVTTDHTNTAPGSRIDRVGFLGFVEIDRAGVIDRGDEVWIGEHRVGEVLGFDSCHFPNHYNILIHSPHPCTGSDLSLSPELPVVFRPVSRPQEPGSSAALIPLDEVLR